MSNQKRLFDTSRQSLDILFPTRLVCALSSSDSDGGSDSSRSTDDDYKLKQGRVKAIVLDQVPKSFGSKSYQLDVYTKVIAASKRSAARTLRWIQQLETATLEQLERLKRRCDDLDLVLAEALMKVVSGQLNKINPNLPNRPSSPLDAALWSRRAMACVPEIPA